jgi:small-conductance mechanosensitive channel
MLALLARHILRMFLHHVHTERSVNGGPGGGMAGLDRVVPVELFSRGSIRVCIIFINVIALLEAIVWRISSVSGWRVDPTRAVRSMSVTLAGF